MFNKATYLLIAYLTLHSVVCVMELLLCSFLFHFVYYCLLLLYLPVLPCYMVNKDEYRVYCHFTQTSASVACEELNNFFSKHTAQLAAVKMKQAL